jgi:MFS family permease
MEIMCVLFRNDSAESKPWTVFGFPESTILGLISSMHSLGSILSVPFVPFVVDKTGRRLSVQLGSILVRFSALPAAWMYS